MDATCATPDMVQNSVSCIAISGAGAVTGAGTWRAGGGATGAAARGATLAGAATLGKAPSGISSGRGSHFVIWKIGA
jgi:hypothetical protein